MIATRIIEHLDSGASGPLDLTTEDRLDETRENEMLVSGPDWFGEADADLLRWGDSRLQEAIGAEMVALSQDLAVTGPPPRQAGRAIVPPEWAQHIRSLRTRRL